MSCPHSHANFAKIKLGHVGVDSKIVEMFLLVSTKSYLVIIWHNSHKKLRKSEIMSSWNLFEYFSK